MLYLKIFQRREYKVFAALTLLAVVYGMYTAAKLAWTCDDSFISFQYARNLVRGIGLVFNPSERVEGETNFLWTVWAALGMKVGVTPEAWSNFWGIVCYGLTITLLAVLALRDATRRSATAMVLPVAALGAAFHRDWTTFATSGLETASFTLLALAGYAALVWRRQPNAACAAASGLLLALCSLSRPDGIIFAVVCGAFVLWRAPQKVRAVLAFSLSFSVIWVPFMFWRYSFYGDLVPNTYYAKSAYLTWYDQGFNYLILYLFRYWVLVAVPLVAIVLTVNPFKLLPRYRLREAPEQNEIHWLEPHVVLAAAMAGAYCFYIVRVGGDFMFARLFIPAAPFAMIVVEHSVNILARRKRNLYGALAAGALVLLLIAMPSPMRGRGFYLGIADERAYYDARHVEKLERRSVTLKRYFEGLPMRVAFSGGMARMVYRLDVPLAIESATGLTDKTVARQKLTKRGRPGHEKVAKLSYLMQRRTCLWLGNAKHVAEQPGYANKWILLDNIAVPVLYRDPEIFRELERRGAKDVQPEAIKTRHYDTL